MPDEVSLTFAGPEMPDAPWAEPPRPQPATQSVPQSVDGMIVDSKGRRLKMRELTILQELDLMAIAGDGRAMNRPWWMHVLAAARVAEIDGVPLNFPTGDQEMRATLLRVGREGIASILEQIAKDQPGTEADEALSKN